MVTPHKPVVQMIVTGQPRNKTVVVVRIVVVVVFIFIPLTTITVTLVLTATGAPEAVGLEPETGVLATETASPLARKRS